MNSNTIKIQFVQKISWNLGELALFVILNPHHNGANKQSENWFLWQTKRALKLTTYSYMSLEVYNFFSFQDCIIEELLENNALFHKWLVLYS